MPTYNNKTIVLHELIGLWVQVLRSSDPSQIGIHGTVIDETKNTLLIQTDKGVKRVVKPVSTFKFKYGKKGFVVDGEEISFRSYERIEKGLKFYKKRKL
jgi:ribonuclease P protein subunit POP4